MKRISGDDLKRLYATPPASLERGVRDALAGLPEGKENNIVKKKISIGMILAAALALFSVTALAAGGVKLFQHMGRYANPIQPLDGAEALVVENLARGENEWVTVTVEEAAYDGQGAMVLARLTVKDAEKYALLTDSNDPEELKDYDVEYVPSEVGEADSLSDGHFEIRNSTKEQALLVDGKEAAIPESEAEAEEKGYPVYRADGKLFWAGMTEPSILGRKDGRIAIGFSLNLDTVPAEEGGGAFPEADDPFDSITSDAELQADGSVLCWFDCFAAKPLAEDLRMRLRPYLTVGGEFLEMEPVIFTLRPAGEERAFRLIPEAGDDAAGPVRIHSVVIHQTKVRGYLTVDFDCAPENEDAWVDFALLDVQGHAIRSGSAGEMGPEPDGPGSSRWHMELQAFDEVPDTLTLVVSGESGELGRFACRVEEE